MTDAVLSISIFVDVFLTDRIFHVSRMYLFFHMYKLITEIFWFRDSREFAIPHVSVMSPLKLTQLPHLGYDKPAFKPPDITKFTNLQISHGLTMSKPTCAALWKWGSNRVTSCWKQWWLHSELIKQLSGDKVPVVMWITSPLQCQGILQSGVDWC